MKTLLSTIALLTSLGWATGILSQDGEMPPALVQVATAQMQLLAPVIQVSGTVASRFDARVSAEVEGRLVMVADVGLRVAKGEPLAQIEDTMLRLRQDELTAEVERVRARLVYLEKEEGRFASLAESNLAAATQLEQTRSDRDVARGDLRVAQSRLAQNEDRLARTVIMAPFPGVVVERLMTAGERASNGDEVVRLVDQASLEVIARAPLDYFPFVAQGQQLSLESPRKKAQARVRTVVAVGDENTHLFELRLDLEEGLFPAGQTLRVAVPMDDSREVLAVPRDSLILRPQGITIFVVDDENRARQVNVTTGLGAGDQIEVRGALKAGDRVVIRGNERLQPGQSVSVAGN